MQGCARCIHRSEARPGSPSSALQQRELEQACSGMFLVPRSRQCGAGSTEVSHPHTARRTCQDWPSPPGRRSLAVTVPALGLQVLVRDRALPHIPTQECGKRDCSLGTKERARRVLNTGDPSQGRGGGTQANPNLGSARNLWKAPHPHPQPKGVLQQCWPRFASTA